ncbi:MAG: hypothetical protein AB201_03350 [Parcubacteria bacterium C7867-006]|nr:MAG: hypothetical protein AB201_03350 [Parcubacteria bacterium C7867-006]
MAKSILKKINSLPIPLTIKHYYAFGDIGSILKNGKLDSVDSWNTLRSSHDSFSISTNRAEWLKACEMEIKKDGQDNGLKQRALDIVKVLNNSGIQLLFSTGVGGAGLEYNIKKYKPELKLICSEYSAVSVETLQKVFIEADSIELFDISSKEWPKYLSENNSIAMIYRVDASFTDKEWRNIFINMHNSGVKNILYIPTNFLTIFSLFIRIKRRIMWMLKGESFAFAGYLRTKTTFQGYWKDLYTVKEDNFGGLRGFVLKRINT